MERRVVAGVVLSLYTAAGRRAGDAELALWDRALADLTNEAAAEEAVMLIVRHSDRFTTPREFRDTYQAVLRRHQDARSLPEGRQEWNPAPEEKQAVLSGIADLKRKIAGHPAEPV